MNHIEEYLQLFLSSEQRSFLEYEIRFGTKHSRITRSKYENVLSFLKSQGFHISNSNSLLRIKCDNHDVRTDTMTPEYQHGRTHRPIMDMPIRMNMNQRHLHIFLLPWQKQVSCEGLGDPRPPSPP